MTEADVVHDILLAWGHHPKLRIARINTGAAVIKGVLVRFGVKGTGDIVGLMQPHGRMLMIECKSASGKQREAQRTMQRVVTTMGGLYLLARSLEEFDAAMLSLGFTR